LDIFIEQSLVKRFNLFKTEASESTTNRRVGLQMIIFLNSRDVFKKWEERERERERERSGGRSGIYPLRLFIVTG
jgi:hypothetical protein